MFPDHKNQAMSVQEISKHLELKNILPNNPWIKKEVSREISENTLNEMKLKT